MLPFKSHMKDEILVEYKEEEVRYEITSIPHKNAFGELCGKPKKNKRKNKWTEDDLLSFKQLGYAVCNNTLDSHGRKVYIHHNMRTFKENKNK